jgi:hypothetical protein
MQDVAGWARWKYKEAHKVLQCTCKQKTVIIEGVSFNATLSKPAWLHWKSASGETSCDSWSAQGSHKRNRLYIHLRAYSIRSVYIISWIMTVLLTDWLTTWSSSSSILPEQLIVPQLVKKFPIFYKTCRFVAAFTRVCHFFLSWARWIQSTLLFCFHKSSFNITHTSNLRYSKWSFQVSSPKFCMQFCSLCVPHALPISFSLIWSP